MHATLIEDNAGYLHIVVEDGDNISGWNVYSGKVDDGLGIADMVAAVTGETADWTDPMTAEEAEWTLDTAHARTDYHIVATCDRAINLSINNALDMGDDASSYLLGTAGQMLRRMF